MTRLAGANRSPSSMTIDYKDVLDQAVANERWRLLRILTQEAEAIYTRSTSGSGYYSSTTDKSPSDMKRQFLAAIKRLETA